MLFNLLITLVVVYLIVVFLVYAGQSRLIYFPEIEQEISNKPSAIGLDYTSVKEALIKSYISVLVTKLSAK